MNQQRMSVYYYYNTTSFFTFEAVMGQGAKYEFQNKDIITSDRFLNDIHINVVQRL